MGRVFAEPDRVQVRHFMGYAGIFVQADLRLENAMTNVQSEPDGGSRPDDSTVIYILGPAIPDGTGLIPQLQDIEAKLQKLWKQAQALEIDELKVDPARGMRMLRMEGRRLVNGISSMLSTYPRRDIFSSAAAHPAGTPYPDIYNNLDRFRA